MSPAQEGVVSMNPKRQALEDAWRDRVQIANTRYRLAVTPLRLLESQRKNQLMPEPDGSLAWRQALQAERLALAEYRKVLRMFTDLTVRSKIPEPDQP